jgi:PKD repeat protein
MKAFLSAALTLTAVALAGCTVHQTSAPALSGPSDLALSIRVTASPDSISQDGGSQSSIQVTAIGPDGKPKTGVPLRMDMFVGGVGQDYGTLSGRTIVTNSSGVATVVYTAPPSPTAGIFGTCKGLPGNCVDIVATASGSGFETAAPESVTIRLVPPGVIQPPAGAPTAAFTFSPQPAAANVAVTFDASSSQVGSGASQIVSYNWTFGDGTSGTGKTVPHTFTTQGSYSVTLIVTNDRTLSHSTQQAVSVAAGSGPTAAFVFSPTPVVANVQTFFDASSSKPGTGHTIASYTWNFGDGDPLSIRTSPLENHDFAAAGTYIVQLTVTDEAGQKAVISQSIVVGAGGGGAGGGGVAPPVAKFTSSPASPGINQDVFFNASSSTAAAGHTLVSYRWDYGDGSTATGVTATHAYSRAGSFVVTLVVTDDTGQTGTFSQSVAVAASSSQIVADFNFSPTDPSITKGTNRVFFDATASSSPSGITSYVWDFGDGSAAGAGRNPNHLYTLPATFVVRLTVTDGAGRTATTTKTVTVAP